MMNRKRFGKYGIYTMVVFLIGISLLSPAPAPASALTITVYKIKAGTNQMYATLSNGQTVPVPANIPGYNANNGFWLDGDFDGDGNTDLLHMVTNGVADPNYCHLHFLKDSGEFRHPTTFVFPSDAHPDYNIRLGYWVAQDLDGDGMRDLKHDPQLPDNRRHCWFSFGNGAFELRDCP